MVTPGEGMYSQLPIRKPLIQHFTRLSLHPRECLVMRRPRALASAADTDVSHLNTVYHTNKYHAVFLLLSSLSISYRPKLPAPPKARMPGDNNIIMLRGALLPL